MDTDPSFTAMMELSQSRNTPQLTFVTQTGRPTKDPVLKRLVRRHARLSVKGNKGEKRKEKVLQYQLVVPGDFGGEISGDGGEGAKVGEEQEGRSNECSERGVVREVEMDSVGLMIQKHTHEVVDVGQSVSPPHNVARQTGWSRSAPEDQVLKEDIRSTKKVLNESVIINAKVKMRCRTCKLRYLKCDKIKPVCDRCSKSIAERDSDLTIPNKLRAPAAKFKSHLLTHRLSTTPNFENEMEALYFQVFQDETSSDLSGVFRSYFWKALVLQEAHHQAFVRHAVTGIAALSKSIKTAYHVSTPSFTLQNADSSKLQRKFAFEQYGKALKGMRLSQWRSENQVRKVLIATLLTCVFETMNGDQDLALSHALVGDKLICNWIKAHPHVVPWTEGISSPLNHVVEDEIQLTFVRFDLQLLTFLDTRGSLFHEDGKTTSWATIEEMPMFFTHLTEATRYWELIMRRSCHFIISAAEKSRPEELRRDFIYQMQGRTLDIVSEICIYGSPFIVPTNLLLERNAHISDLSRWSNAASHLFTSAAYSTYGLRTSTAALIIQCYTLAIRIAVEGTTFVSETPYDIFTSQFEEIITLAEMIANNMESLGNEQPAYHFHLSIVPPLFIVVLRCRDLVLRRRAIALLKGSRRNGCWDPRMVGEIGEWIMSLEEGRERVSLSRLRISLEGRGVLVQCVRRDEGGGVLGWEEVWIESW